MASGLKPESPTKIHGGFNKFTHTNFPRHRLMEFNELDIHDFGHKIMASGIIYTDGDKDYALYYPGEIMHAGFNMFPTLQEWEALLKQTDDVLVQSSRDNPLVKAYVKKSVRNIDQNTCWQVYVRDNYTCRYCGKTGIPLTVDHIDLWEDGGITTEDNLNTSCKHCNRDRGNMKYADWLQSPKYARNSVKLDPSVQRANVLQIQTLPLLEARRVNYKRAPR